jgi:polyisoprenoid-binding protein YceI
LLAACGLTSPGRAADVRLSIQYPQSHIDIVVHATVDSFVGTLGACQPEISVRDDGEIAGARIAFRFRDVVTGKKSRDKAMHEWQHTDEFPDGVFVLSNIEAASEGPRTAFGRLTFHGITRDVRFPVAIVREGLRYLIDGDVPVDVRDFGLPAIRLLGVLRVDPVVHVRFHLQAARETPAP